MKSFFESIWAVLRVALFGWLLAVIGFIRAFLVWLRRLLGENHEQERQRKAAKTRSIFSALPPPSTT